MKKTIPFSCLAALHLAVGAALFAPAAAMAADSDSAVHLLRQNGCFRCHAFDRNKEGPTWHKIAEKYHGRADAAERLRGYLTSDRSMALFADGHEELHKALRADPADADGKIGNAVSWILAPETQTLSGR